LRFSTPAIPKTKDYFQQKDLLQHVLVGMIMRAKNNRVFFGWMSCFGSQLLPFFIKNLSRDVRMFEIR
jgi:hypothetical protein